MEVRCKICRFKFDVPFDESQKEVVANCPRCGTPQLVEMIEDSMSEEDTTASDNNTETATQSASRSEQVAATTDTKDLKSTTPKPQRKKIDFNHPTPSASLKLDSATGSDDNGKKIGYKVIRTLLILIALGIAAYYGYHFLKDQKVKLDADQNNVELFDE